MWFDTLVLQLRLHMAYRVNGILYRLRFLSLSYESGFAKTLGLVLAILRELLGLLLGKLLYMAAFFAAPLLLFPSEPPAGLYGHLLLFLTLIGGIFNSKLLDAEQDVYYAVFLLRMDARALCSVGIRVYAAEGFYGLSDSGAGGGAVGPPSTTGPVPADAGAGVLREAHRRRAGAGALYPPAQAGQGGKMVPGAPGPRPAPAGGGVSAAHAGWLGHPKRGGVCRLWLFAFCGAWGACVLVRFPSFRQLYHRIFTPDNLALLTGDTNPAAKETQAQYRSKLTLDSGPESRKTGCVRFNELFMRRNRRLLMRPARRTAVIAAVVLAAGCAACLISPAAAAAVNGLVVQALPGMLLLMYFINRGNTVTRALFFNCDRSMLCYRFYRQPRVILGIFTARLKSLTAINLLPTTVIALGLPLLLLCSGGHGHAIGLCGAGPVHSGHVRVLLGTLSGAVLPAPALHCGLGEHQLCLSDHHRSDLRCVLPDLRQCPRLHCLRRGCGPLCRRVCGRSSAAGLSPGPQDLQAADLILCM